VTVWTDDMMSFPQFFGLKWMLLTNRNNELYTIGAIMSYPQTILICIVMLASVLNTSCDRESANNEPATASSVSKKVTIGGTLPLTGSYSDTGRWIEHGYRCWAEKINKNGGLLGRKVDLLIYDDKSDPDKAVSLFEQVIVQDKADLLLGGYPATSAALQMPAAERHKMVYVSMGGHMQSFEQGFDFSFGGPPLMGQWWYEGFWQWLESLPPVDRPHRMATISVNNIVGLAIREGALEGAARLGIEVAMDELYDLPLERAEELVARAKETQADLFVASGFLPDGVLTVRAMKSQGYNPSFLVQGIGSIVPQWKQDLESDGNLVFSGTPIHPKLPFPEIKELNDLARKQFGVSEAPAYFLFGYAWLQTLQAGVQGVGNLDQKAIRDYLRSHTVVTIGGSFTFDKRGLPRPYNYLTQVQPTAVELIWPLEVRTAGPVFPKPPWKN
jgi:branched-chain amino acid transport system substrate-binding protein